MKAGTSIPKRRRIGFVVKSLAWHTAICTSLLGDGSSISIDPSNPIDILRNPQLNESDGGLFTAGSNFNISIFLAIHESLLLWFLVNQLVNGG